MSFRPCEEPRCSDPREGVLLIEGRAKDLGGMMVRRVLPNRLKRTVGPFIFLDEMGPVDFGPGEGIDVRPHPHINLATVTYLFEGAIVHKDSLGSDTVIEPGAINLMTAGRGIVHSERTPPEAHKKGQRLHGIQLWFALPEDQEEIAPAFEHTPAKSVPEKQVGDALVRVMMGEAFGVRSPVTTYSPSLYAEVTLPEGASIDAPAQEELAVYPVKGALRVDGFELEAGNLLVLTHGRSPRVESAGGQSRFVLLGGEPIGERHIYWNFVSSRPERIEEAKRAWREGEFPKVPGDEDAFIPLPD